MISQHVYFDAVMANSILNLSMYEAVWSYHHQFLENRLKS